MRRIWGGIRMLSHPYRLNILMSIGHRWWDNGIRSVRLEAALCRMITVWHQSTARAIRKHNDPSALLLLSRYTVIILRSAASSRTNLLSIGPTYGKPQGECWTHSELREPRGERRQMLKRKPIFIQTTRRKLHIRVNWYNLFITQPYQRGKPVVWVYLLCVLYLSIKGYWHALKT